MPEIPCLELYQSIVIYVSRALLLLLLLLLVNDRAEAEACYARA
jgi:hypothetical protein